jgi:transposase
MEKVRPAADPVPVPPKPRVQVIDRRQMVLRPMEVEQLIPPDHPARAIWELVGQRDLGRFFAEIKAVEGVAGREPVDPQLLISLWIYAYSEKIGSAREIERRCGQLHPGFGWLTGLTVINHHTLSDFRTAHRAGLEQLFVEVLGVLSQAGVVSLERVMHDGTKIKANAADNSFRREPSLRQHLEAAQQQVKRLERQAEQDPAGQAQSRRQRQAQVRAARERQQRIEQSLAELEQIRAAKKNDPQERAQARASLSDPEARIMKQAQGALGPAYNVQISTDAGQRIIVGVGVSQAATDTAELEPAVERIEANLEQQPQQMVVDGGFTHQATVEAMAHSGIELIGSLTDRRALTEATLRKRGVAAEFFPSAFAYDPEQNHYTCPAGKVLRYEGREKQNGATRHRYRAATADCQACPLRGQCCPDSRKGRSLVRTEDAPVMAAFKAKMATEAAQQIYKQRAGVAEFPNAWIKDKLGLRQFRLRGRVKVGLEALWVCLTYNIQQWIRLVWRPQRQVAPVAT